MIIGSNQFTLGQELKVSKFWKIKNNPRIILTAKAWAEIQRNDPVDTWLILERDRDAIIILLIWFLINNISEYISNILRASK